MDHLVYLASPYSHPVAAGRADRVELVCAAAAALLARGSLVYAPIAHSHPIALAGGLETDAVTGSTIAGRASVGRSCG